MAFWHAKDSLLLCKKPCLGFADEPVLENVLPRIAAVYVCAACENGAMWPFPLPEDKACFASEIKIKVRFSRFYFVFRSTCIIFVA
jgi:hypothetical protein